MKRYFVVTMCMLSLVVLCCACGNNDNKYNYIELGNDVYNMSEADYKGACAALIRPLAREPLYTVGVPLEKAQRQKKINK